MRINAGSCSDGKRVLGKRCDALDIQKADPNIFWVISTINRPEDLKEIINTENLASVSKAESLLFIFISSNNVRTKHPVSS